MQNETDFFKALGDPLRLRIVALLRQGERCVCDLVAILGASQSTVSRHLSTLRKAGIVQARREGTWMHYSINPQLPSWARSVLEGIDQLAETHPELIADIQRLNTTCCSISQD